MQKLNSQISQNSKPHIKKSAQGKNIKINKTCYVPTYIVTTHSHDTILSAFGSHNLDFPGGHPSQYYSNRSTLNCGVLIGSWLSRL
jgi:hypothetical protein